ncbi:hypothetical protein [Acinetobacter indicus]|uniref:hypothetical protein n=1 Tax=Acinetobacter indicus TaxID=756892 RepID=UPI001362F764|nr:hypothetical protein [Acinetobacter indicus]
MKKSYLIFIIFINILFMIIFREDYVFYILPITISLFLLLKLIDDSMKSGGTIFHPLPMACFILAISVVMAPAISSGLQVYLLSAPRSINWDKWLGILSWLYLLGIILFYLSCRLFLNNKSFQYSLDIELHKKNFILVSFLFLFLSLISQILVFQKFGGVISYMTKWTEDRSDFDGLGIWYMFAEPFPMIFLIFLILLIGKDKLKNSIIYLSIIFLIFFVLKMLFGGFRGSRSNTIWGLYWFAGIVHLYIYRLKKIHYIVGILFLTIFMSTYALYKSYGVDAFSGDYSVTETNRYQNNPLLDIYLGDFSRATINAYQISQISDLSNYEEKYGQTYLSSASKFFPPIKYFYSGHDKNSAGSEIVNNIKINPQVEEYHNSRVFGIYGEAILNFGIFFGIFSFFFVGFFVSKLDNYCRSSANKSVFIFIIPFLSNMAITLILSDSDNIVFFVFKNGLLVFLYLYFISIFCVKGYKYVR